MVMFPGYKEAKVYQLAHTSAEEVWSLRMLVTMIASVEEQCPSHLLFLGLAVVASHDPLILSFLLNEKTLQHAEEQKWAQWNKQIYILTKTYPTFFYVLTASPAHIVCVTISILNSQLNKKIFSTNYLIWYSFLVHSLFKESYRIPPPEMMLKSLNGVCAHHKHVI